MGRELSSLVSRFCRVGPSRSYAMRLIVLFCAGISKFTGYIYGFGQPYKFAIGLVTCHTCMCVCMFIQFIYSCCHTCVCVCVCMRMFIHVVTPMKNNLLMQSHQKCLALVAIRVPCKYSASGCEMRGLVFPLLAMILL